jgi:DNA-binding transcriptional LysR family regulator
MRTSALSRLRELLRDPLFVRDGPCLRPTPRAESLAGPLRRSLIDVREQLLHPTVFDPGLAQRTFVLASADYSDGLLLPGLVARLEREAPGIRLVQRVGNQGASEAIQDVDLAIGPLDAASGHIRSRVLLVDPFVCLLRRDHPCAELDLERYLSLGHVLVAPRGMPGGLVDIALAAMGRQRRVMVHVQNFSIAPMVVAGSDLVTTLPETLARRAAEILPLRLLSPPLELAATRIHAVWHERWHHDPGHRWFRDQVVDTMAAYTREHA